MWKPSVMDAPSSGAPEQAPRWDLVGTEGCGGGIRFLAPYLIVWGYVGIYRRKEYVGGATWDPRGRAARPRGGAPHPRGPHEAPPTYSFLLYIPMYPQTIRYGAKNLIPSPQLSVSTRSHLGACSGAPPEGVSITEGFYIINIAPPMKCE